jgi:hypothetical protein
MPLKSGAGHATISHNIAELMAAYASTGMIGNTTPKSLAHAKKIATAIAYNKAGYGKPKHPHAGKKSVVSKGKR